MSRRRGSSLVEVMIAVSATLLIGMFATNLLTNAVRLNTLISDREPAARSMRVSMGLLRRQLQLAYLTPSISAVETYRTVFVGRDDSPDTLFFATRAHQRLYRDSRECDQAEVTVWAERMPDDSPGYALYHRESPRIDEEPDEGGQPYPIAYNVKTFELRYLDPTTNEWRNEWDSEGADTPSRLPRAVEIALVVYTPNPRKPGEYEERATKTTVVLAFADKLQQQSGSEGFGR